MSIQISDKLLQAVKKEHGWDGDIIIKQADSSFVVFDDGFGRMYCVALTETGRVRKHSLRHWD